MLDSSFTVLDISEMSVHLLLKKIGLWTKQYQLNNNSIHFLKGQKLYFGSAMGRISISNKLATLININNTVITLITIILTSINTHTHTNTHTVNLQF